MSNDERSLGRVEVAPAAIASVVNHAVRECYGVVDMANKNLTESIAHLLSKEGHQGIDISIVGNDICIDVYVIIEYGMRISAVANSIKNSVGFHVEKSLGVPAKEVNVYVNGLRFSGPD